MPVKGIGPGDVVRVDLDHEWHTYGRILARASKVAFYDCRTTEPIEDMTTIVNGSVLFVLAIYDRIFKKSIWPKVGHVPLERAPVPIPDQFMQDIGTNKCRIVDEFFNVRPADPEDCVGLEKVAVWDAEHVEERLRDHYVGRQNWQVAHQQVRL